MTRWHGTTIPTGFAPLARPTARTIRFGPRAIDAVREFDDADGGERALSIAVSSANALD